MGITSVDKEPVVDGYLRGQLWNRPTSKKKRYLCFRIWHPWQSTGRHEANFGFEQHQRQIQPGYYTDQDSLDNLIGYWQRQATPIYMPSYPDFYGLRMGEGGLVRVRGFDDVPSPYLAGNPITNTDPTWLASAALLTATTRANFYNYSGGSDNLCDIFLALDSLSGSQYYGIEFSNEQGRPVSEIGSMSASLVDFPVLTPNSAMDYYPEGATELERWGDRINYLYDRGIYTNTFGADTNVQIFIYNSRDNTGYWLKTIDDVSFFGF
jgi:hypothetical protein